MATEDMRLLMEYARNGSEASFEELVNRYASLVHSAAIRQVSDPDLADEITQSVFVILARKAKTISRKAVLAGWLYRTTRYVAAAALKARHRRHRREHEAYMQTLTEGTSEATWNDVAPLLDNAMASLSGGDRDAILLRYFQNRSLREVGAELGVSENAAQKRVERALERLRSILGRRGAIATTAGIAGLIAVNSVRAMPTPMAQPLAGVAVSKGLTASAAVSRLTEGAIRIMNLAKLRVFAVTTAAILAVGGTATVTIGTIESRHVKPGLWQVKEITLSATLLDRIPPTVQILPTKFNQAVSVRDGIGIRKGRGGRMAGLNQSLSEILRAAYGGSSPQRMVVAAGLPEDKFDFISTEPDPNAALQLELRDRFALNARHQWIQTNVMVLNVRSQEFAGLRPGTGKESVTATQNQISASNSTLQPLVWYLETTYFQVPVIDRTGLTNRIDYEIKWQSDSWRRLNLDHLKKALTDQLGLELVPAVEPVDMIVIESAH